MRQLIYYKMRQKFVAKCVRFFFTNCDSFITKCDSYYKMLRLLQIATLQWTFNWLIFWNNIFRRIFWKILKKMKMAESSRSLLSPIKKKVKRSKLAGMVTTKTTFKSEWKIENLKILKILRCRGFKWRNSFNFRC